MVLIFAIQNKFEDYIHSGIGRINVSLKDLILKLFALEK